MTGTRRPSAVTAVLAASVLTVVSQLYVTIPLVPSIAAEYGVPRGAAGWSGTVFGLAFAAGAALIPAFADRVDPRRLMALGMLGVVGAGVLAALAPTLPLLVAARAAQGFAVPALPPVALAYLPQVLTGRARASGLAVVSTAFLLAGVVGQAWSLVVEPYVGWRGALLLGPAPALALAVLVARLPAVPVRPGAALSAGASLRAVVRVLARPGMVVAGAGAAAALATFVALYVALEDSVGAGFSSLGLLLRLPGLPGVLIGCFAGVLVTRWGGYRTGRAAFVVGALALGVVALDGPLWVSLTASGVYVAGIAVAVPAVVWLVGRASGEERGAGVAGYACCVGLGSSVGPVLASGLSGSGLSGTCAVLALILLVPAGALTVAARWAQRETAPTRR